MFLVKRRELALFGAIAAVASAPGVAWAQDAGAAAQPALGVGGGEIGDIIVTAQRREQSLQKVPVAVSTLNAAQIEARHLNNIDQISGIAPNLVITTGNTSSSSTQIAIRGSVTTNNTINYDPAVGLYLDGVYVGKASGSVFDIGDLERVEVLRGPQGTLFGRNTLAGAISFVTRKPSDKLRIEGEATYGNYNAMSARGLVNIPLTNTLFVKVSGQFQKRDGFTKLVPDPFGLPSSLAHSATGDVDDRDRWSVMGQVRWKPIDGLTIDYTFDRSHTDEHPFSGLYAVGTNPIYDQLKAATTGSAAFPAGFGTGNIFDPASPYYSGLPLSPYVVPNSDRPKTASTDVRSRDISRVYGHSLIIAYDTGFGTLKSITAYRNVYINQGPLGQDIDGAPIAIALGGFVDHYNQFSQELQLTGQAVDNRLNYTLGGYYFKDNAQGDDPQSYFLGATNLNTVLGLRSRAFAAYGQVDFKVTDKLTITGGARWTSERKTVNRLYQVLNPAGPPLTLIDITKDNQCLAAPTTNLAGAAFEQCNPSNHHTFSNVSPSAIVAYQFTDDLNVYAKYSIGFRSGSYNADAGPSSNPANFASDVLTFFKPEKNKSIELGVKSRFFDRRLTVNVAGFYNTEMDKQVASFLGEQAASTINRNAGKGRVKGVELEFDARPVDRLHLYGAAGILRAHFLHYEDVVLDSGGAQTLPAGSVTDVANNRYYPKSPRTTLSGGADLELYRSEERGTITLSGDARYQSKTFALPGAINFDPNFPLVATSDQYRIPSETLVNARLRWDNIPLGGSGLKGYAMLWVKNLTNQTRVNNIIEFGPNFGGLADSNYMDPRTYGMTLGFKY